MSACPASAAQAKPLVTSTDSLTGQKDTNGQACPTSTNPARRRHRAGRGKGGVTSAQGHACEQQPWRGVEQRAVLMRLVPRCVLEQDRREVMSLLRDPAVMLREAGQTVDGGESKAEAAAVQPKKSQASAQLTLLQGACLEGSSVHMVSMLLVNGCSPNITTPMMPSSTNNSKDRKQTCTGGYTPLLLALIGGGRERNAVGA